MSDLHTQTMSLYIYTISSLSIHLSRILSLSIIITQVVKFLLILFYGNLQETSFKVIKSSLLRFVFCFVISVFFILRKSFSSEGLQNAHLQFFSSLVYVGLILFCLNFKHITKSFQFSFILPQIPNQLFQQHLLNNLPFILLVFGGNLAIY